MKIIIEDTPVAAEVYPPMFDDLNKRKKVTTEIQSNSVSMKELAEMFAGLCISYGYHCDTVAEFVICDMFPEEEKD